MYNHLIDHTKIIMESFPSLDDICLGEEIIVEASHEVNEETSSDNAHNLNEDDIVPKVHMCFDTLEAVKVFYKNYAINIGFGVRIRSSLRGADNEINYIKLVFSREGSNLEYVFLWATHLHSTLPLAPHHRTGAQHQGGIIAMHVVSTSSYALHTS